MTEITVFLVKKLRKLTSAGVMDCKKALIATNGNIDLAIENMRKSGAIKAAQKTENITTEGVIITKISGNYGIILEINCQTDFLIRNSSFQKFTKKILNAAIDGKIADIKVIKEQFEEERILLVNKLGENINIRRVASLEGEVLGAYQHGTRIGVLVAAKGADSNLVKQIAMHVAACKPEFVKPEDIPVEMIRKEHKIQLEIAMQSTTSKEIVEKIVEGRMKKFIDEISLTGQLFIINPNKSVAQLLEANNSDITGFIRFEIGEDIEK